MNDSSPVFDRLAVIGEISRALGIDPKKTKSVTIRLDAGVPTVEIVKFIDSDMADKIAQVLKRFTLVEIEEGR